MKVYGINNNYYLNEIVVADVVINNNINITYILRMLETKLPRYKLPQLINIVEHIDKVKNYKTI